MHGDRDARTAGGGDSAIGDFQRVHGRILELDPPLAPKTLACTDWVASHYIWETHSDYQMAPSKVCGYRLQVYRYKQSTLLQSTF